MHLIVLVFDFHDFSSLFFFSLNLRSCSHPVFIVNPEHEIMLFLLNLYSLLRIAFHRIYAKAYFRLSNNMIMRTLPEV